MGRRCVLVSLSCVGYVCLLREWNWGIDLIFKNQAMTPKDKGQGHFVNDLLRTEFHKFVSFLLFSCLVRIDQSRTENSWPNLSRYSSQDLIPLDNY